MVITIVFILLFLCAENPPCGCSAHMDSNMENITIFGVSLVFDFDEKIIAAEYEIYFIQGG